MADSRAPSRPAASAAPRELFPCPLPHPVVAASFPVPAKVASRACRRRSTMKELTQQWENEAVLALNQAFAPGRAPDPSFRATSAAQRACLDRIRDTFRTFGQPEPMSPAAAFDALRRTRPGYGDPGPRATFRQELLSLPITKGVFADGDSILHGDDLAAWRDWRSLLLRHPDDALRQRRQLWLDTPYSDPALVRRPRVYAAFVADLMSRGLVSLYDETPATVGTFFVWKKGKEKLRMILDTRIANTSFVEPWHCSLPTAASWSQLEVPVDGRLLLSQMDVDNAFYRIRCPPGMNEHFVMPAVKRSHLEALGVTLPAGSSVRVSPRLEVLAMGFNWSLYFCQAMVKQCVLRAGIKEPQLVEDRRVPPCLASEVGSAVYVDGAAIIGLHDQVVEKYAVKVLDQLNAAGLLCHDIENHGEEQIFTGLDIRQDGIIRVQPKRAWRLRLALVHVLQKGRVSGDDLRCLIGHFTWCALLRREALSLVSSVYAFMSAAGPHTWTLWASVRRELRWMAALIPLLATDTRSIWSDTI